MPGRLPLCQMLALLDELEHRDARDRLGDARDPEERLGPHRLAALAVGEPVALRVDEPPVLHDGERAARDAALPHEALDGGVEALETARVLGAGDAEHCEEGERAEGQAESHC